MSEDNIKYKCDHCNYETDYQTNFIRHKKSKKHIQKECAPNTVSQKLAKISPKVSQNKVNDDANNYKCVECGKIYLHASSLSKHKTKKCRINEINQLKEENEK